jgi:LmbE family N-acetylglucosaminyl deacetylase
VVPVVFFGTDPILLTIILLGRRMKRLEKTALFVGAHADDIELGAGGTVYKLRKDGWDIWFFILTFPEDPIKELERKT